MKTAASFLIQAKERERNGSIVHTETDAGDAHSHRDTDGGEGASMLPDETSTEVSMSEILIPTVVTFFICAAGTHLVYVSSFGQLYIIIF